MTFISMVFLVIYSEHWLLSKDTVIREQITIENKSIINLNIMKFEKPRSNWGKTTNFWQSKRRDISFTVIYIIIFLNFNFSGIVKKDIIHILN